MRQIGEELGYSTDKILNWFKQKRKTDAKKGRIILNVIIIIFTKKIF